MKYPVDIKKICESEENQLLKKQAERNFFGVKITKLKKNLKKKLQSKFQLKSKFSSKLFRQLKFLLQYKSDSNY